MSAAFSEVPLLEDFPELEIRADRFVVLQGQQILLEACIFAHPASEHSVRWTLEQGAACLSQNFGRTTVLQTDHRSETVVVAAHTADRRLSHRVEVKAKPLSHQSFSCGDAHSLALTSDGQVLVWGEKYVSEPTLVGLTQIQSVAAGSKHSLALTQAQTVLSWGDNSLNQLGRLWQDPGIALEVTDLTEVLEINAGTVHSLATHLDGSASAWGSNLFGQLGFASLSAQLQFSRVPRLERVSAVQAGFGHSLALTDTGQVLAWGANDSGQLGIGTTKDMSEPTPIVLPMAVAAIQTGMYHSAALTNDGQVLTWGRSFRDGMGKPLRDSYRSLPIIVPDLGDIASIAAGHGFIVARSGQGNVFIWNQHRVWNSKFSANSHYPTLVTGLEEIVAVQAGTAHVLALRADGTLFAWGDNSFGQLGITETHCLNSPCKVVLPKGIRLKMPV